MTTSSQTTLPAPGKPAVSQAVPAPMWPRYPIAAEDARTLAWASGLFAAGVMLATGAALWGIVFTRRRERRLWRWYDRAP